MLSFPFSNNSSNISDFKQTFNIDIEHDLNLCHNICMSSIIHWQAKVQSSQFMLQSFLLPPSQTPSSQSDRDQIDSIKFQQLLADKCHIIIIKF